jgi:2-hydroxy-6-oxonona-2,4-dienedioate hydrolase
VISEESTSKFVQTSKWRLHYNELGSGSPVIMIHGGGPGSTGWNNFVRNIGPLAERFRVLCLDLPGFGQSDPLDPTVEPRNYSPAVQLFMDELGIEKTALVGNSLGGNVSLQFAVDHPDRVTHVVAMGAGYGDVEVFTTAGSVRAIEVMREAFAAPTPENFRRLIKAMTFDSSFITEEMLEERSRRALANPTHLENQLKQATAPGAPDPTNLIRSLRGNPTPTLLIHGRNDEATALEASLRVLAAMPNSRAYLINRCGHWAQFEYADEFNELVLGFLSR